MRQERFFVFLVSAYEESLWLMLIVDTLWKPKELVESRSIHELLNLNAHISNQFVPFESRCIIVYLLLSEMFLIR